MQVDMVVGVGGEAEKRQLWLNGDLSTNPLQSGISSEMGLTPSPEPNPPASSASIFKKSLVFLGWNRKGEEHLPNT